MSSIDTQQTSARLAWFLTGAYPGRSRRKRIARDFDVSPETAKGWLLASAWPRQNSFVAMGHKWGPDFFAFVFGAITPGVMEEQARAAEDRLANMVQERIDEDARGTAAFAVAAMGVASAGGRPEEAGASSCSSGAHQEEADPLGAPVGGSARQ